MIEVAAPSGDFVLDTEKTNPIVFISSGVGVTPFMSMLDHLISAGKQRPVTWIHGCRGYQVHGFKDIVRELGEKHGAMSVHTFYDKIEQQTEDGYYEGFVDLSKVQQAIQPNAEYYICGPGAFIKKHFDYLCSQSLKRDNIHFEEFGPATLAVG